MITEDLIQYLSDEQKQTLQALESTFGSPGWKIIKKWMAARSEEMKSRVLGASSWDQTLLIRGALGESLEIQNLEITAANEFALRAEEAKDRAADVEGFEVEYE